MSWWVLVLILVVGVGSGLLLARIERVRIRDDERGDDGDRRR